MNKPGQLFLGTVIGSLLSFNAFAGDDNHKHDFSKSVSEFHDVLSPLWHADKDPKRQENTCKAIGAMKEKASHIEHSEKLVAALDNLKTQCAASKEDFEKSFSALHDEFHALKEVAKKHG